MKPMMYILIIVFGVNSLLAIVYVMDYLTFNSYVAQSLTATWFMVFPVIMLVINVKEDEVEG